MKIWFDVVADEDAEEEEDDQDNDDGGGDVGDDGNNFVGDKCSWCLGGERPRASFAV